MTPEQVANHYNEQPKPEDEHKHREDVGYEIAESEAFCEEEHRHSPCSLDRSVAGVAPRLRIFCRLRHAPDLCRGNSCTPPSTGQRPHAFARRVTGRRASRKLSRTAHGESAAGRFDMRGSRLELVDAIDLPVHAFQRGGEHLLAPQGVLGCARKACASLRPFSAHRTAIFARKGALLIAHLAQTLAQRPEVIKRSVIDFGMVTAQGDLMLVIAENAALEFTGYGHGGPSVSCAAANEDWYYVHSRRINTAASERWWQDVPWLSTRNRPGGIHR